MKDEQKILSKLKELTEKRTELMQKVASIEGAISALQSLIEDSDLNTPYSYQRINSNEADKNYAKSISEIDIEEKGGNNKKEKKKYVFDDGYHLNMSYNNKVKFVIKQFNRFVHNREIAEELHSREPELTEDEWSRKVSGALSTLRRRGELVNFSVNGINRNTFWGSPKWMDEDDQIIDEYMYDEEYLQYGGEEIEL